MKRTTKWIITGAVAAAVLAVGSTVAFATGEGDDQPPITGDELDRATAAALAHTGGGQVTETEVGDEEGYYEVEVQLPDGRQVDVHLDQSFTVLNSTSDDADDADGR